MLCATHFNVNGCAARRENVKKHMQNVFERVKKNSDPATAMLWM